MRLGRRAERRLGWAAGREVKHRCHAVCTLAECTTAGGACRETDETPPCMRPLRCMMLDHVQLKRSGLPAGCLTDSGWCNWYLPQGCGVLTVRVDKPSSDGGQGERACAAHRRGCRAGPRGSASTTCLHACCQLRLVVLLSRGGARTELHACESSPPPPLSQS